MSIGLTYTPNLNSVFGGLKCDGMYVCMKCLHMYMCETIDTWVLTQNACLVYVCTYVCVRDLICNKHVLCV